jgi:hypothetical protein
MLLCAAAATAADDVSAAAVSSAAPQRAWGARGRHLLDKCAPAGSQLGME